MTKVPEDEAVVEAGAGALVEAAEAGSVEDSEEAGEGADLEIAAVASEASGEAVPPSEREVMEARLEEEGDSEEMQQEEVKAALNSQENLNITFSLPSVGKFFSNTFCCCKCFLKQLHSFENVL